MFLSYRTVLNKTLPLAVLTDVDNASNEAVTRKIGLNGTESKFQKQLFSDFLQNKCSFDFCNIHGKTTVLVSLFS